MDTPQSERASRNKTAANAAVVLFPRAQRRRAHKGNGLIPYAEVRSCIKEHPQKQLRRRARGGGPVIASAITRQRRRGPPSPVPVGEGAPRSTTPKAQTCAP